MPRLSGLETEYAMAAFSQQGERIAAEHAGERIMQLARRRLTHLDGHGGSGIYMANGGRFYVDCGKPEWATPECVDPWSVCRYYLAGHELMAELAAEWKDDDNSAGDVFISHCNVSYSGNRTTWGAHESHGHRSDSALLARELIPHFVSRQIYTGGGGFHCNSPGIEFLISPRAVHLEAETSGESTRRRGIFHTKNEPLCGNGMSRLHVLCGEGLSSQTAILLKAATTSLILTAIEAGARPGNAARLAEPLVAMRAIAKDVTMSLPVSIALRPEDTTTQRTTSRVSRIAGIRASRRERSVGGKSGTVVAGVTTAGESGIGVAHKLGPHATALEIQRSYLNCVERFLDHPSMPEWAETICRLWRETLDRLASGVHAVERRLDWAIKLWVYSRHAERNGFAWESFPVWNEAMEDVRARLAQVSESHPVRPALTVELFKSNSQVRAMFKEWQPRLREAGQDYERLPELLALRAQLFELDFRFGQLDSQGIFRSLDAAGVLDHRADGVGDPRQAIDVPPSEGRARLRGDAIRELAQSRRRGSCEWSSVYDITSRRTLDLSDPFDASPQWREFRAMEPPDNSLLERAANMVFSQVTRLYDQGEYDAAQESLASMYRLRRGFSSPLFRMAARHRSWVQARRGMLEAVATLDESLAETPIDFAAVCDYLAAHRFTGLIPSRESERWIELGDAMIRDGEANVGSMTLFLEYKGAWLLSAGSTDEALSVAEAALDDTSFDAAHTRTQARLLALLADARFRLGDLDAAVPLDQARSIQQQHGYTGDEAEISMSLLAKIQFAGADRDAALATLGTAVESLIRVRHLMGEVRCRLLQARMLNGQRTNAATELRSLALRRLIEASAARTGLADCRLAQRIRDNWELWTSGRQIEGEVDPYWKL